MELCRETLEEYLRTNTHRDIAESLNVFKQIVEGLVFLHSQKKVHRDIKPANILFALTSKDSDLCVRIADFGLAREVGNYSTTQVSGTLLYMAPEMFLKRCDEKWDMFSAGLILMELLYDCSGKNHDDLLFDAKHNDFPEAFQNELNFALPVLKKLLRPRSSERPSSYELLNILCDDPNWKKHSKMAPASQIEEDGQFAASPTEKDVQFESTCTFEEHVMSQEIRWSTLTILSWNGEGGSEYFPLTAADASNTRWEVKFDRWLDDEFAVIVRCVSLDAQFRAASVQMFAAVEDQPQVWTEVAAVLKPGGESMWWWGCFSKKMSELPNLRPLNVRVRVQWSELDHPLSTPSIFCSSGTAKIQCRWQLNNWKVVDPTTECWNLFSKTFGGRGALWRIFVEKQRTELVIGVELQDLLTSVNWKELSWKCSLSLWNRKFDEQNKDMKQSLFCSWTAIEDVKSEIRDPLDLNVMIDVIRKNEAS